MHRDKLKFQGSSCLLSTKNKPDLELFYAVNSIFHTAFQSGYSFPDYRFSFTPSIFLALEWSFRRHTRFFRLDAFPLDYFVRDYPFTDLDKECRRLAFTCVFISQSDTGRETFLVLKVALPSDRISSVPCYYKYQAIPHKATPCLKAQQRQGDSNRPTWEWHKKSQSKNRKQSQQSPRPCSVCDAGNFSPESR